MRFEPLSVEFHEPVEVAVVDVEADERRERDERMISFFENVFHMLNAYQSHQETAYDLRMSLRAMCLALGFSLAAGAEGAADLARQCGMSKQTVNKCLNHFLEQLRLEPLPFQRDAEARLNMAEARKRQLKPKNDHVLHGNHQCRD